ncbi:MAG TPA: PD-(D/E)XK nuclease family protein, partial [Cyclobacteriaceae bacterium]|nr:PD-(D/E)XK nuclease family protein [Cyclobacteriaceae bacterium]
APVVKHINVTMGYPLMASAAYQLLEQLIELQVGVKQNHFDHRKVQTILTHPYMQAIERVKSPELLHHINKENRTSIAEDFFQEVDLFKKIFSIVNTADTLNYLREVLNFVAAQKQISSVDKEYIFHLYKQLNRIHDVIGDEVHDLRSFQRLFRQLCRTQRIPFVAEPLKGIQVMGVLETRSIDFKNVFVLSMNEGNWPAGSSGNSYIPYNIRKAYGLPSVEHADAIQAYHFYRSLQRANNIHLFYNTEADKLGGGEKSRYLQQLMYESALPVQEHVLSTGVNPQQAQAISIAKNEQVQKKLAMYFESHVADRAFYPTNLTDYLECSLRFYFKHIEKIKETDEVEDDLDARILGDILHRCMEFFYEDLKKALGEKTIEASVIEKQEKLLNTYIDKAFQAKYKHLEGKQMTYEGQQLIVKEIVYRFAKQVLKLDKAYAPFNIVGLEEKNFSISLNLKNGKDKVQLRGIIDRVDLKDDVLRIVDYKTGKDVAAHKGELADLFMRDGKVNKAAFQVLMYALLYAGKAGNDYKILPGLLSRSDLFNPEFKFGLKFNGATITDARELLPEFTHHLLEMMEEIYNPEIPFKQTERLENCLYCSFKEICYR